MGWGLGWGWGWGWGVGGLGWFKTKLLDLLTPTLKPQPAAPDRQPPTLNRQPPAATPTPTPNPINIEPHLEAEVLEGGQVARDLDVGRLLVDL